MIKLKDKAATHTVLKDTGSLKHDLKKLKQVLFETFGVIGIQITDSAHKMAGLLTKAKVPHVFYHVEEDVYLILCTDVTKEDLEDFYRYVKEGGPTELSQNCIHTQTLF